jgi:hypothetical protein
MPVSGLRVSLLVVAIRLDVMRMSWDVLAAAKKIIPGSPRLPTKYPHSETTPLAKSTTIEEHIMVGQTRNILKADKV